MMAKVTLSPRGLLSPERQSGLDFSDLHVDVATPASSKSRSVRGFGDISTPSFSERSRDETSQSRNFYVEETTPLREHHVVRHTTPFSDTHFRDNVASQLSPHTTPKPTPSPASFLHTRGTGRFSTPGVPSKSLAPQPSTLFTPSRSMGSIMGSSNQLSHREDLGATSDILKQTHTPTQAPITKTCVFALCGPLVVRTDLCTE